MGGITISVALSVALLAMTPVNAAETNLSNAEAQQILEKQWAPMTYYVCLGDLDVVAEGGCANGRVGEGIYGYLLPYKDVGLIRIDVDQEFEKFKAGKTFSWSQSLDMATNAIKQKVKITLTSKGQAASIRISPHGATFKAGDKVIQSIIRNEHQRVGVTDFRVLMLTYKSVWDEDYRKARALYGLDLSQSGKAIIALKHDPFEKRWIVVAQDLSAMDRDFTTDNVAKMLRGER